MTTKDQIIALAKQAGIPFNKYGLVGCNTCETDIDDALEAFHRLALDAYRTELLAGAGEPVAWMYPSDLEKFQTSETFAHAFSVKVGCPDEVSVPVFTASQVAAIRLQELEAQRSHDKWVLDAQGERITALEAENAQLREQNTMLDAKCAELERSEVSAKHFHDLFHFASEENNALRTELAELRGKRVALITERVIECAQRLVEHADFKLGGILSADSKAKDIPSNAVSQVKSRHLAALRDALAAHGITGEAL